MAAMASSSSWAGRGLFDMSQIHPAPRPMGVSHDHAGVNDCDAGTSTSRHPRTAADLRRRGDLRYTHMTLPLTPLMQRLGIQVPVIQAPIGSPCSPTLAAAVSAAGALGMLAGSWAPVPALLAQIERVRRHTTRPFGVNLVLQWPQPDRSRACLDAGVAVISTFWGDPTGLVETIRSAGAIQVHTVGSVADANQAADTGADVVVAQGWEAGGEVGSIALITAVVDGPHRSPSPVGSPTAVAWPLPWRWAPRPPGWARRSCSRSRRTPGADTKRSSSTPASTTPLMG